MDAEKSPRLASWVGLTGTLPVPRDVLLGDPLKVAARGYLADADPGRASDADLEQSVKRFVAPASSSSGAGSGNAAERGGERDATSARTLGYPYMIHGEPNHDLWIVDYLNALPFFQSLAGKLRFSPSKHAAGAGGSDAFARTSMLDALLADRLGSIPGIEPAFVEDREDSELPNIKFYFNGGSENREIDVPVRRGGVLVAVQTWASEVDPKMAEGDRRSMKRRWDETKKKLRATDKYYTDYLLCRPEGRRRMEGEGLGYVLPIVCSPFTEPVASLKPEFWLRRLSTLSHARAEKALPRVLSPTELEHFLATATERELREICEANGWEV